MTIVFLMIPFAIITVFILGIAGVKTKSGLEGEDSMKNIYTYLVLFVTLMMVIGGSVSVFIAGADIISPSPYSQSFEDYTEWGEDYSDDKDNKLTEEELEKKYNAMVERNNEQSKKMSINTLIKSFAWILIPLPIFIFFQRKVRK